MTLTRLSGLIPDNILYMLQRSCHSAEQFICLTRTPEQAAELAVVVGIKAEKLIFVRDSIIDNYPELKRYMIEDAGEWPTMTQHPTKS